MIGTLRLITRAFLSLACILSIIILMSVTWPLSARKTTRHIMQGAFMFGSWVWNIRIRTLGALAPGRPLIIVSNHFTYLDLFVLGSQIPATFTPKSEIRSWPIIGFMSAMAGCLFIDRRAQRTLENKQRLKEALAAGDIISLFPEGTTNEGKGVLPFKSSFFSLAMETDTPVQPISIVYTHLNGKPAGEDARPVIGWYGDSFFFPHAARFLKQRSADATMLYHKPLYARDFTSRKELAAHCQSVIEQGMDEVIKKKRL